MNPNEVLPDNIPNMPQYGNRTEVIVRVTTPSGRPISGYPIFLYARGVPGSGGHDHYANRPVGNFLQNYGETNEIGEFRTFYYATQFGGIERIIAYGGEISDSADLTVRVPGLILLPESPYYLKVGGTCEHHGPPKPWDPCPIECQTPDNNHYIAFFTSLKLQKACSTYHSITTHRLCINDISLPYGGGFDVCGKWEEDLCPPPCCGHQSHRMGVDIDIATRVVNEQGEVIGWVNSRLLRKIVLRRGGVFRPEGDHYHIRF